MKKVRTLFALVLAVATVLAMSATAFAAPASKAADLTGHTYKAYQIFAGTQTADDTTGKLGNVTWGSGVDGAALLADLKASNAFGETNPFANATTAAQVAEAMKGWADKSDYANAFAKLADKHKSGDGTAVEEGSTTLPAGYYLVVDTTTFGENDKDTVKNLSLLQLTKKSTFTIENKTDIPEVEKKVYDVNDSEATAVTDPANVPAASWQDSADHDVNDVIPYQITGTLPTNYADYTTYKYEFTDVMSAGLTYNADAKVYAVNGDTRTEITSQATIAPTASGAGATLTVTFNNLKAVTGATINKDTKIVVEYTATLNSNAVMGSTGNPNTVKLTYSNNPNHGGDGETGNTPEDKVIVFTYKVTANKVDQNNQPLTGAGFTLYKKNASGNYEAVGQELKGDAMTAFTWNRLDDGDYKIEETTTPPGYNTIAPIEFSITAEHEITSDNPQLLSLNGIATTGTITIGEDSAAAVSKAEGSITTTIVNKQGSTLPETGGIGTIIFYVLGSLLVVGCGIVLISKRRMESR